MTKQKRFCKRAQSVTHARASEVRAVAAELERTGRFGLTRNFIQHGTVSVYAHVISVAMRSLAFADVLRRLHIKVDRPSLIRGALLHDYFLYDWHDPDPAHKIHGFTHPFIALARAREDFQLSHCEETIIKRHMFPLVPIPPSCREAWIVCIADKICALHETIAARSPFRAKTRQRCVVSANTASPKRQSDRNTR
ncbi:HD domain-containing protein [Collinsella sp. zg1085]|uniref:HD domain-containing protein n=1 Tax=Collinsella sp. zg1085 TaxID=2844380 RepID=UPI00209B9F03|nr:HD domain-containing protein [Collinsella sp. zg1085]